MSKVIKLSPEQIAACVEEFRASLEGYKSTDGKLSYSKTLDSGEEKAVVAFSPAAYAKMIMLVQQFDKEVAWNGICKRDENDERRFIISDILVYPQEVTGATVTVDAGRYADWMCSLSDEVFNNLRFQGHSHVNMGVTPSGVDMNQQRDTLAQLGDDMFYVFMIWNKKFDYHCDIYDLKNNTLFETKDVSVEIDGENLDEFISSAKELVVSKTYSYAKPAATAPAAKTWQPYSAPAKKVENKAPVVVHYDEEEDNPYSDFMTMDEIRDPFFASDGWNFRKGGWR